MDEKTSEINKLLEKHLEPDEVIQYTTFPNPNMAIAVQNEFVAFGRLARIIIITFILICAFIYYSDSARFSMLNFLLIGVCCVILYLVINAFLSFVLNAINTSTRETRYYYITNKRIIVLYHGDNSDDVIQFLPISYSVNMYKKHNSIYFSNNDTHEMLAFLNISDVQEPYYLLKGKIKQ